MRKFALVMLVAGWMALGVGSAKAAAMPQGGGGTTVTVNSNGQPATGGTFVLDLANAGKIAHSTGTVDSNGTPSNVLDLANVGKVRVDVYVEVCQNGQHILVVNSGVVPPDDGTCHDRHRIDGAFWLTGSDTIKIDTGTGTVDVTHNGTGTSLTGGQTGGFTPWEAFGGFEYLRLVEDSANFAGFDLRALYNTNSWLGLGFAYDYKRLTGESESATLQIYGGAVQLNDRTKTWTPFGFFEMGGAHISGSSSGGSTGGTTGELGIPRSETTGGGTSGSSSANAFAMKLGGGLDLNITPSIAIRLGQMDWVYTHFGGQSQNNYDVIAGITFKIGASK